MFLCFPYFRARHFLQVLVLFIFLVIFEVIYLTWDRKEISLKSTTINVHKHVTCNINHLLYLAKVERSSTGHKELLLFINDTSARVLSPVDDTIHLILVDSLNISSYVIESFLFMESYTSSSVEDVVVPTNKFFMLIAGKFTDQSVLKEILKSNLNLRINSSESGDILVSGFKYNSTETFIDQVSLKAYGSIAGCVQPYEGLTTCEAINRCGANQVFFYASAGSSRLKSPVTICYNNSIYIGPKIKGGRGMNVLLIDDVSLALEEVRHFDTFKEGVAFDDYLHSIGDHKIIIIASENESSQKSHLLESSKVLLEEDFGSAVIKKLSLWDYFVFLGQRGLHSGSAIEKHRKHYIDRPVQIKGCLTAGVGVGILRELSFPKPRKIHSFHQFDTGDTTCPHCPPHHLPVAVETWSKNLKKPKACIGQEIINQTQLGRGLNLVVYDVSEEKINLIQNFDTYDLDDGNISEVLKGVRIRDLVVIFTFDDAIRSLSAQTRNTLKDFGSFYIDQLKMRESWLFIGQRRITGYSPYERLNFGQYKSHNWSEPIHFKGCIPYRIPGLFKPFHSVTDKNRLYYCDKQENSLSKTHFCSELNKWQPLQASLLQNPIFKDSPVFSFPIIVFTTSVESVVQIQLEKINMMSGLNHDNVMVFYDPQIKSYETLIKLFKFKGVAHSKSGQNWYLTEDLLTSLPTIPENAIVLEEGVLPTTHYLEYLAHLYPVLLSDTKLCYIGAYNHHAFLGTSSSSKLKAFRSTDIPPKLSYLIKTACLANNAINNRSPGGEAILPDVSYVARHPMTPDYQGSSPLVRSYVQGKIKLSVNNLLLHSDFYDDLLIKLLRNALLLNLSKDCNDLFLLRKNVVIIFDQEHEDDYANLTNHVSCFFITTQKDNHNIVGVYKGVFRFSYRSIQVFLVGSKSIFLKVFRDIN